MVLANVRFYALAIVGFTSEKVNVKLPSIMKVPYYFCLINAASFVGVLKFIIGQSRMDWTKTARDD